MYCTAYMRHGVLRSLHIPSNTAHSCMQAHLFDINIPGRQTFKESDVLSPGNQLLAFDTGQLSSV